METTAWLKDYVLSELSKATTAAAGTATRSSTSSPRPRLVQILSRGGSFWTDPHTTVDSITVSSSNDRKIAIENPAAWLIVTDGRYSVQANLSRSSIQKIWSSEKGFVRPQSLLFPYSRGQCGVLHKYKLAVQQHDDDNGRKSIVLHVEEWEAKPGMNDWCASTSASSPLIQPMEECVDVRHVLQRVPRKQPKIIGKGKKKIVIADVNAALGDPNLWDAIYAKAAEINASEQEQQQEQQQQQEEDERDDTAKELNPMPQLQRETVERQDDEEEEEEENMNIRDMLSTQPEQITPQTYTGPTTSSKKFSVVRQLFPEKEEESDQVEEVKVEDDAFRLQTQPPPPPTNRVPPQQRQSNMVATVSNASLKKKIPDSRKRKERSSRKRSPPIHSSQKRYPLLSSNHSVRKRRRPLWKTLSTQLADAKLSMITVPLPEERLSRWRAKNLEDDSIGEDDTGTLQV